MDLDSWIEKPTIGVAHRRASDASPHDLWAAAQTVRITDTQLLGRIVRWRIPGTPAEVTYDEMFRRPPFLVLDEGEHFLLSGIVGRIWTLRRDYPQLPDPQAFRDWDRRGTVRVLFASWVTPDGESASALCSEVRVQAFGAQGRLGLAAVRPLVRRFHQLIGTDGIAAAVRRAPSAQR